MKLYIEKIYINKLAPKVEKKGRAEKSFPLFFIETIAFFMLGEACQNKIRLRKKHEKLAAMIRAVLACARCKKIATELALLSANGRAIR